ncbi:MAG: SH3 domain-containing protein, partial [Chloroflexota bacterium]
FPNILPPNLRPPALPAVAVLPTSDPALAAASQSSPLPIDTPSLEIPITLPTNNPAVPDAIVKPESGGLRLRGEPTADAPIVANLAALTPVDVVGRTDDNVWAQVIAPDGNSGWVTAEHLQLSISLADMPVTFATPAPAPLPTVTDTPIPIADAQVKADGSGLNLRDTPGATGEIVTTLAALTPLTVIGRTDDNSWLQVVTPAGNRGWVLAKFLDVFVDLLTVNVTGVAVELTPTPTPTVPTNTPTPKPQTASPGATASQTSVPPTATRSAPYPSISLNTSRAREIFLAGKSLGNRATIFSKVGDSISAGPESSFLSQFGRSDYSLADYSYLQPVVNYFSQQTARENNLSWNNTSLAAANGWGSSEVLNPDNAEHSICAPGESPLACEYRIVKPSVSLIMIGTNDAGGVPLDIYRANLRQIVEYSIQKGVVPVLFTLPPRNYDPATDGRVYEFNAAITQTANDYQIPLIDYWTPMNSAPNLGLKDGVHPSEPPDGKNAHLTAGNMQYGS